MRTFSQVAPNSRTSTSVIASRPCVDGGNEIAPDVTTIASEAPASNASGIRTGRFSSFARR